MRNNKCILIAAAVVLVSLLASPLAGQVIYGQPTSGDLRLVYSYWEVKGDSISSISQFTIPLSAFFPIQENTEMRFFAGNASNDLKVGSDSYALSGLSDIRLQFNRSLSEDRFLLSLGINLPTGKKSLSQDEERMVMEVLTQNFLSFPIRRLGEGFGVNAVFGGATVRNNTRLGASIMYQLNGSYEAYENEGDYKPGNMFSVSVSADNRTDRLHLLGEVIFSVFSNDKHEGIKVFRQSPSLDLRFGSDFMAKSYSFKTDIRYLIRGRNSRYVEEVVVEQLKHYGNEFSLACRFAYFLNEKSYIVPLADIRLIAGNEYEEQYKIGKSDNFGLGLEYGRKLGQSVNADIGFKYITGSADDGRFDLSGYRMSAGIQATF
jgi:hypothetical protein